MSKPLDKTRQFRSYFSKKYLKIKSRKPGRVNTGVIFDGPIELRIQGGVI